MQIDRQQFEETVRTLNNLYAEAEKLGGQSYLEGCLACLTAYTIFLCMETHYEKVRFSCLPCQVKALCLFDVIKDLCLGGFSVTCIVVQIPCRLFLQRVHVYVGLLVGVSLSSKVVLLRGARTAEDSGGFCL